MAEKIINPFVDLIPEVQVEVADTQQPPAFAIGYGDEALKVDKQGLWLGANQFADAPFRVDMDGNGYFQGTITGSVITGSTLSTGDTGENVKINSNSIELRNGTTVYGFLRGYAGISGGNGSTLEVNYLQVNTIAPSSMIIGYLNGIGTSIYSDDGLTIMGTFGVVIDDDLDITGDTSLHSIFVSNHKLYDIGAPSNAFDDVYADDFQNVADFLFLDDRDDLAELNKIKGSGTLEPRTGIEMIDDNTVPEWMLTKHKETGEIIYASDGKPYIALKTMVSLLMGATRQLGRKIEALETQMTKR